MAKITMELIKELREKTQVGMMDCKKALILTEGDIEKAIEHLRKKGALVAAKRAEHETNNGTIAAYVSPDLTVGALLEVACETDFSAKTPDMQKFSETVAQHLAKTTQCSDTWCDAACLMEQPLFNDDTKTVKTLLDDLISKISENIKVSRCARFTAEKTGLVNAYIHPGATLGIMVELEVTGLSEENKPTVSQLAKDLCMQIAVTSPLSVDPSQLDAETIEKEQCIIKEQLKQAGKPDEIIDKIMVGKINKYYEEVCLLKQKYIKQDKVTIEKHITAVGQETGCQISVKQYVRFAIGK